VDRRDGFLFATYSQIQYSELKAITEIPYFRWRVTIDC
jgi:hypothetical protein